METLISDVHLQFREQLVKVVKEENFWKGDIVTNDLYTLPERFKTLLNSLNGFFVISNYTTGLYEYISDSIEAHLGYDIKNLTPKQQTDFIFSIMEPSHATFLLNSLLPVIFKYFKQHSTAITGTDYRYTCCIKIKDVYNNYLWHLVDTVIIEVNEEGFPTRTLVTATNINQFKKDNLVYYNIMKKNSDGVYEIMLEGIDESKRNEYKLSPREIEIINLISNGYTNNQIAEKLFLTPNTVKTHRKNVLKKTGCKGVAELTNFAFSRGFL